MNIDFNGVPLGVSEIFAIESNNNSPNNNNNNQQYRKRNDTMILEPKL